MGKALFRPDAQTGRGMGVILRLLQVAPVATAAAFFVFIVLPAIGGIVDNLPAGVL